MREGEKKTPAPVSDHKEIINNYYNNGHNGTRAVMEARPHIKSNAAAVIWQEIKRSPANRAYIQERQNELRARADITQEQVLKELINHAYNDITEYMNLTPEEIKQLPAEARRSIQSFKAVKRTVYDKKGNKNVIETLEIKAVDKLKAVDMIAKNIGLYEADNAQKANRINILQLLQKNSPETLNNLLQTMEQQQQDTNTE